MLATQSSLGFYKAPLCPQCKKQMMLSRVIPQASGIDDVAFDCRACGISEKVLLKR